VLHVVPAECSTSSISPDPIHISTLHSPPLHLSLARSLAVPPALPVGYERRHKPRAPLLGPPPAKLYEAAAWASLGVGRASARTARPTTGRDRRRGAHRPRRVPHGCSRRKAVKRPPFTGVKRPPFTGGGLTQAASTAARVATGGVGFTALSHESRRGSAESRVSARLS
jgi:hypothetical protein